jgi:hypothetical protein
VLIAILLPELPVCQHAPMRSAIKLVEFDSYGGVQQTELRNNLLSRFRRMRYVQERWKQVSQVEVECAQCGNELLDLVGLGIEQLYSVVDLLSQFIPVDVNEGIRTRDLSDYIVGDSGALSELGQVQLLDAVALADVMHQVERVPFSPKKSHGSLPLPTPYL